MFLFIDALSWNERFLSISHKYIYKFIVLKQWETCGVSSKRLNLWNWVQGMFNRSNFKGSGIAEQGHRNLCWSGPKMFDLGWADDLFYCSVWVICTSRSGITPPKIANFSIFIPSDQKILGSKPDWTLIYWGLEIWPVGVMAYLYKNPDKKNWWKNPLTIYSFSFKVP